MYRINPGARGPICLLFLPLMLASFVLTSGTPALAGDPASRLERQMEVMERAINEMLVESPNFLVSGSEVTESIDDDDGGVLFLFKASLTGAGWGGRMALRNLRWDSGEKSIIVLKGDDGEWGDEEINLDDAEITVKDGEVTIRSKDGKKVKVIEREKDDAGEPSTLKAEREPGGKSSTKERQVEKYESAKEELITVLIDHGEFLKALPPGAPVRIVARLSDTGLPKEKMVRKLSVRAKIDDLRAYGDGKLSEKEMRARVEVRES